jgi:hypothetical protein
MRTNYELADAINLFGIGLLSKVKLTPLQQKVLGKIASCRTAALGGHEEHCNNCGTVRYSYNSCGDKHCMDGPEFLRRFTMHILPGRFVKIRRYGIYNHTAKRKLKLQFVPEESSDIDTLIKRKEPPETNLQRFKRLTGVDPCQCPVCKKGNMRVVRELPRIRSPVWRFTIKLPVPVL